MPGTILFWYKADRKVDDGMRNHSLDELRMAARPQKHTNIFASVWCGIMMNESLFRRASGEAVCKYAATEMKYYSYFG